MLATDPPPPPRPRRRAPRRTAVVAALAATVATLAVFPSPGAQALDAPATVIAMETEAQADPLGIDDATPTLSWHLESEARGVTQTAYRVLVSSSAARAEAGRGDLWDSGQVSGSDTQVRYAGSPLESRTRYFWTVTTWTPEENERSAAAWFETAYLDAGEWQGDWIAGEPRSSATGTAAEGQADDVPLLPDTVVTQPAGAGATNLKVTNVNGFTVGQQVDVGLGEGAQTVVVDSVGSATAQTTLVAPVETGDTRVFLASVTGLASGSEVRLGAQMLTAGEVGTAAGTNRTLQAPADAGATNIKVNNTGGFTVGQQMLIGSGAQAVRRTVTVVGTSGATGTGVTFEPALAAAVPSGAPARGLGSGVAVSPALGAPLPAATLVVAPGSGVGFAPALEQAAEPGTTVRRTGAEDVCRPVGNSPNAGVCKPIRPTFLMRKEFQVAPTSSNGRVVSARLYSTGLGWNEPSVNGELTQPGGHLNPGFTDFEDTVQYTTDDVTALIQQSPTAVSTNVVASEVAAGRYNSESVPSNHRFETAQWRAQEVLRADLWITYADGTQQLVRSDDTWRTSTDGPTRYNDFDNGETFDARQVIDGWNTTTYDASTWQPTRLIDGPDGEVVAMAHEPTELVAEHEGPFYSWTTSSGARAFDTGRQRVGWAEVEVWGAEPGQVIRAVYVERRNDDTSIDNPVVPGTGQDGELQFAGNLQQGYYVSDGTGTEENPETFVMNWNFAGFQWVQVDGNNGAELPDNVNVDVASVQEVRTNFEEVGTFETDNELLNDIYANVRGSVSADWIAGYSMDTPTYEKDGWTGDAQIILPTVMNIFDIQRNLEKLSRDAVDSQQDDGQVGLLIPGAEGYGYCSPSSSGPTLSYVPCQNAPSLNVFKSVGNGATPIWDAFLMVVPWEAYQRYQDLGGIETAYPSMVSYLDDWIQGGKPYSQGPGGWFVRDGSEDWTLSTHLGDWAFVTGADGNAAEGTNLNVGGLQAASGTAFTAYLASLTADSARLLYEDTGDERYLRDQERYEQLFELIRADFNERWWDEERGFYAENETQELRQGFQAWAIGFGLVEEENKRALQEKLAYDVAVTRTGHMMIGFVGMRWMWPVLTEAAHDGVPYAKEALFSVAQQTTYPSYGYHIGLGYTGVGEYWEASTRTRNHQFQGSIGQWFYEELAGIKPGSPGYEEIVVRPLVGGEHGVHEVSATLDTIQGEVASGWNDTEDELVMDVTIPVNTSAEIHVPAEFADQVFESGTGAETSAAEAEGVTLVGPEDDAIVFEVGSGTYRFRVDKLAEPGPTQTTVGGSAARGTYGRPVTLRAEVAGESPTGTVAFTVGSRQLGTAVLEDGVAQLRLGGTVLSSGSKTIGVAYSGDEANAASTGSFRAVIAKARSTVTTRVTPARVTTATRPTLRVRVSAPGVSILGRVAVTRGGTVIRRARLEDGRATFTLPRSSVGVARLGVVYRGATNVTTSSQQVTYRVRRP